MPPLNDFDDYDRCLQEFTDESLYCFVRADVEAQPNAEAWQAIKNVTQYSKHHFDHGHLYFGICVKWCQSQIDAMPKNETDDLFEGILNNNKVVNTYLNLFESEEGNRQLYNKLMNQCVNLRLKRYDLTALSAIEYCDSRNQNNNEKAFSHDRWNIAFYIVICTLVLLVTCSSFYDLYLKHKNRDKFLTDVDHYKKSPGHVVQKLGVGFSIARNWYRLSQEPNGKIGRDLRFLDCMKFFAMFLVVYAHTNWIAFESALSDPQDIEELLHTVAGSVLVGGLLIVLAFFVISGFLFALNWLAVTRDRKEMSGVEYLLTFLKFNIFRYLRLTILYGFFILLSGVYFPNAGGPIYRHLVERETLACRKNWWTNLLYVNNYIKRDERCMLQGWYLASDTQSFVFSLLLLILAHKFPKLRNWIFAVTIAVFVAISGVLTYTNKFLALTVPAPQSQRDSFMHNKQFNESYTPFHMNFGSYFFGVLAALIYDHISSRDIKLRQNKYFNIFFFALIPAGIFWMLSGHLFFQYYNDERTRVLSSIYAAFHRNFWGLGTAIFIIGMSAKCGWIFRRFCCLPVFRILGRLTYGAYLSHVLIARVVIGTIRYPIYFGSGFMFMFLVFDMVSAYFVSLIMAIGIELPVTSYLKMLR
ncbi:nose resistant to fluoxetine protein 6-like [Musca vetustissima]|uniref:nose resistant to fluoxetine protein 6-like n=1 Tax=Musca vetustissima TaxID=27455 RepID=UPI002AB61164|nr:nose resistant to fluoxetine protein 6-like [Musca vetustissima]